jgi:hypothetical protein
MSPCIKLNASNKRKVTYRCCNSHEYVTQARLRKAKSEAKSEAETSPLRQLVDYVDDEDRQGEGNPELDNAINPEQLETEDNTEGTTEFPDLNCRRCVVFQSTEQRCTAVPESLTSQHSPNCVSIGRETGAALAMKCAATIQGGREKGAKWKVADMQDTARSEGFGNLSRSTTHRIFSAPRTDLESQASEDWARLVPYCRRIVEENPGSTVGLKTLARNAGLERIVVRVFRSDERSQLIEEFSGIL